MNTSKILTIYFFSLIFLSGLSCSDLAYSRNQPCIDLNSLKYLKSLKADLKLKCVPDLHEFKKLSYEKVSFRLKLYSIPDSYQLKLIRNFRAPVELILNEVPSNYDLKRLKYFGLSPRFKLKKTPDLDEIKRLKFYGFWVEKITLNPTD